MCVAGSEIRLTIGANRTTPSLSIRPDKRPSNLGLRLRWGNGDVANNFSASNGNIQARSVRKSVHEAGDTADTRELEHETKILSHEDHQEGTADSGYSTFKFNADLDKIESSCTHEQQWLELEIIDRDMMGVCCAGHISLNQFLDPARSRGSFTVPLFSFYKSANQTPIGEAFIEFLVIHPFYHKNKGLAYSFRNYWTGHREGRTTLDIGHRGAGRSYRSDVMDQADIRENTLLSFSEAGKAGAEYVPERAHTHAVNAGRRRRGRARWRALNALTLYRTTGSNCAAQSDRLKAACSPTCLVPSPRPSLNPSISRLLALALPSHHPSLGSHSVRALTHLPLAGTWS